MLTLSLLAPFLLVEAQVDFIVSVIANRDVGTSVNLTVFSVSNMTAGFAQGKISFEQF